MMAKGHSSGNRPNRPSPPTPTVTTALAQDLTRAMAEIYRRGWCDGTGGNFSCVASRDPLQLLMAPSGVHKGRVAPHELIAVDGSGAVLRGPGKASAETALHLEIIRSCGAGAVLHTHSQAGTLLSRWVLREHNTAAGWAPNTAEAQGMLSFSGLEMLKGLRGVSTHATRVDLPVLANDQAIEALAQRARPLLPSAPHGLLIAGHGLYAWGSDLPEAERHLEILEFLMEQRWRQLLLDAHVDRAPANNSEPWPP